MLPLLLAAETESPHAFDAARENAGMVVVGVITLVLWLLFRRILKKDEPPQAGKKD